ncbi:MAG: VOC family protein [Acidobacteria bacterium]|nr:VOC family protein [Acidobacteriota bacterium]
MKVKGLVPMLATEDLARTVAFYEKFLGFECRGKYPADNPCWVSLQNGESELAFHLPNSETDFERPALTGTLYLHVENVDEVWNNIKDKVEIVYGLEDFDYGMREFGIRDCNGYILNLGQNIEY